MLVLLLVLLFGYLIFNHIAETKRREAIDRMLWYRYSEQNQHEWDME